MKKAESPPSSAPSKSVLQKAYAEKLFNVMRPEALGRLARRKQGRERCEMTFAFEDKKLNASFGFATASKSEVQVAKLAKAWQPKPRYFCRHGSC